MKETEGRYRVIVSKYYYSGDSLEEFLNEKAAEGLALVWMRAGNLFVNPIFVFERSCDARQTGRQDLDES